MVERRRSSAPDGLMGQRVIFIYVEGQSPSQVIDDGEDDDVTKKWRNGDFGQMDKSSASGAVDRCRLR